MKHKVWRPAGRKPDSRAEMICGDTFRVEPKVTFGDVVQYGASLRPCNECFGQHSREVANWEAGRS